MAPELLGLEEDTLDSKFLGELLDIPFAWPSSFVSYMDASLLKLS